MEAPIQAAGGRVWWGVPKPPNLDLMRTGETYRPMTPEEIAARNAANRPSRWRVSKATLIERIEAAGKLAEFAGAIGQATPLQQFRFSQVSSLWSDNAQVIGVVQALGLEPGVILDLDTVAG